MAEALRRATESEYSRRSIDDDGKPRGRNRALAANGGTISLGAADVGPLL